MVETTKQMSLRATVLEEGGEWVAHCLDLDIVEVAASRETALDALVAAIGAQLSYAREHDNFEHLFTPAPQEAWDKLGEIMKGDYETIVRQIPSDSGAERLEIMAA